MTRFAPRGGPATRKSIAFGTEGRFRHGFYGVLALVVSCAGPSTDVAWDAHDPANPERLDHGEWQALLDAYLMTEDPSGVHLVDYAKLRANAADRARLGDYIDYLQGLDPRTYAKDVQMAYWINLYNAVTLRVVVDAYPVGSIKEIHEGLIPGTGPWRDIHASVAGHALTLDNIEHDILRPIWRDNRIHYGVNCASIGCPNLAAEAYTAENLERLLDQAARDYVNHPRGVTLRADGSAVVSSIYSWYREDFGDSEAGVLEHLRTYAGEDLAERLRGFGKSLDHDYDWSLNAPRTR